MKFLIIPIGVFLGIAWAFSLFFSSASAVYASDAPCGAGGGILGYTSCCKDAKLCPDGTVLGRTLPMCIFPECPGSGGGGTNAACSSAAKNYAYTDTAYSPSNLCVSGSSPTVGNGAVPFPAPGKTVTWSCFNSSSPTVTCSASRDAAPAITCGTANGKTYPTSGPPSADRCVNTTQTNFAFRYSGSYWNGWTWNCGTASCSANLSPGICGTANGTTRATAPSTVAERCSAGVSSAVSGSGPWSWSCTGTACSASKTVSCTPSCSLNPASYCTTHYLGSDGCGGSCGYGTMVCPTPRLKVCPAAVTLNPTQTQQLEARYWANLASIPSCSTTGYSMVTPSAAWSSSVPSVATVGNISGTKGVVTAGSPASTSLANIQALYIGLPSFSAVTVNGVVASPSATISGSGCSIPLGASTCDGTFTWTISGATSPNVFNATRSIQYTTASSGNNSPFAITYGANTVQARDGATVLATTSVSGTCASGTWDSSKCAAASGQLLTVSKSGSGTGTITSVPAGISYPGDATESYSTGTSVVLTATATLGSTFTGWSGDCTGTGTCTVVMNSPKNVSASFAAPPTCTCDNPNACVGSSYTGTGSGCVPNGCSGTKVCDQHWKEVAP
ncbi:MAG: hypothetical protein IPJ67_01430 [Candidatus Moraniibacteriota bacterium]|nr:MAG: hypothetical protein IPJ67_01430 [Candidatus Moranbacteria bacterium]